MSRVSDLFLGLDVGTQGTKAVLVDAAEGRVVARAGVSYGLIEGLPAGAAEQHPHTWIDAVGRVVGELLAAPGVNAADVRGLGVSGQQHGLVVLDEHDEVVRPAKLWCDTSTAAEARALSREVGRLVPTGFTAPKVRWMARHEPDLWARVRTVMLPHDYVNFRLTGRKCAEAGDASGTGYFDVQRRDYDYGLAAEVDDRLPDLLPPLLGPGEVAGPLNPAGAALLGLSAGIPVATGGGDNMLSAIGSGATRPGVVVVSLGTSGTMFTHCRSPVIDPEGLIAPFCDSIGGWLPLLCVMNLTGVTEEVRAAFAGADGEPADLEQLTQQASLVPAGCDGLMWLPYLQGERVPDLPLASGTLFGIRPGSLRRERLFRAAMEGTSLNLGWGAERLRKLGVRVDEVRLVGGAARNPLWRRILADVLAAPVSCLEEPESAALGGAIQAAWTVRRAAGEELDVHAVAEPFVRPSADVTVPEQEGVELYRALGARFRDAVADTYGASGGGSGPGRLG